MAEPLPYHELPQLADYYLEDSYVLNLVETADSLTFSMLLVLTESHPAYRPPLPGEQYCYARGDLRFSTVRDTIWLKREFRPTTDADGTIDYGNIDVMTVADGTAYQLSGDWGRVEFEAADVRIELD